MYTLNNEHIITDYDEALSVMKISHNKKAYPENLIKRFTLVFENENNCEKLIKNLRSAPPRSFGDNVVRYFSDFFGGILLDLEKKYAEPLAKQVENVVSLFLADRNEIHIMPDGCEIRIVFRIGGSDYDSVMQRYEELKAAILGLIQQYSEV